MKTYTHSIPVGYILWIFGFTGAHRFYFGKPWTGTLYFFTFGLCGIGWVVDFFLIPRLSLKAGQIYHEGFFDYGIAWLLLTFLGVLGFHRFYMGKWISGILYFFTGGLFLAGYLHDLWNLNSQLDELNRRASPN